MEPDLAEIKELVEENNRIVRKLLSHQRYSTMISVLKWGLIVGAALGTYYFLQPYVDPFVNAYNSLHGVLNPGESLVKSMGGQ